MKAKAEAQFRKAEVSSPVAIEPILHKPWKIWSCINKLTPESIQVRFVSQPWEKMRIQEFNAEMRKLIEAGKDGETKI